ncbi:SDR family oxidoreductase [Micromonospora sp. CPCC 205371]|nr:SDR family oxidoreductase [Micromonospora sp. CPCC 205371]
MTVRAALVTGASAGIGEAFAEALARNGVALVLVARRQEMLERVAKRLRDRYGVHVEVLAADLSEPADRALVAARLSDSDHPIDLLVNNAGAGSGRPNLLADQPPDRLDDTIALNVTALVQLTRAAVLAMRERRSGAVLNVSSVAAFLPQPQGAVYAATKAFVTSFTETVHCEMRQFGVRVVAVCPGFTRRGDVVERGGTRSSPMPAFLWLDREAVVRDALTALAADRVVSVPSTRYRLLLGVARLLPRRAVRRGFERLWATPR